MWISLNLFKCWFVPATNRPTTGITDLSLSLLNHYRPAKSNYLLPQKMYCSTLWQSCSSPENAHEIGTIQWTNVDYCGLIVRARKKNMVFFPDLLESVSRIQRGDIGVSPLIISYNKGELTHNHDSWLVHHQNWCSIPSHSQFSHPAIGGVPKEGRPRRFSSTLLNFINI